MPMFRKKPVVVEAVQVTNEWFTGDHPNPLHPQGLTIDPAGCYVEVPTPGGMLTARVGDWIITDADGGRHPCKPDVFAATYGPVEPSKETMPGPRTLSKEQLKQDLASIHARGCGPEHEGNMAADRVSAHIDALAEQLEQAEADKAAYLIDACYFPSQGEAELGWTNIETGEEVSLTVKIGEEDGHKLARVVPACVYHRAKSRAALTEQLKQANDTLARLRDYGIYTRNFGDGNASALWDRIDEFRGDENATLSDEDVRALAEWWTELHEQLCDLDDRYIAADEAREKATKERNIFRDGLVGSEAELAVAEKRIAALGEVAEAARMPGQPKYGPLCAALAVLDGKPPPRPPARVPYDPVADREIVSPGRQRPLDQKGG